MTIYLSVDVGAALPSGNCQNCQSVEWPSLVYSVYDVTKVCSVDRLPITGFSFGIKMMLKNNAIKKRFKSHEPFNFRVIS